MTQAPHERSTDPEDFVRAGLSSLSREYPQMPASVADRLDRVLAELPELTAPDTSRPVVAPIPTRWWRRRWGFATATVTAVAAVFGTLLLATQPWSSVNQPTTAQDNAEADAKQQTAPGEEAAPPGGTDKGADETEDDTFNENGIDQAYQVTFSGHDYSPGKDMAFALTASSSVAEAEIDPQLLAIAEDQARLDNCVASVEIGFQGTATNVDFGSFEGDPAIVVVVSTGTDTGTIAAQRPGCGQNGLDLFHSQDL